MLTLTEVQNVVFQHGVAGLSQAVSVPSINVHLSNSPKENLLQVLYHARDWALQLLPRAHIEILHAVDKTPVLHLCIPAFGQKQRDSVFFYGHFDKQPEGPGWHYPAFQATLVDDRLYGRGTADDCYSFYTAVLCAYVCRQHNLSHPTILGLFETDEEAGSADLHYWLNIIQQKKHYSPKHLIILDLDGPTTDRLWLTKSTRGVLSFDLFIKTLTHPVHSGQGGGVCPSAFRIFRTLLSRIEDQRTGKILVSECHTDIPETLQNTLQKTAQIHTVLSYPWHQNTKAQGDSSLERLQNIAWNPCIRILGLDHIPSTQNASAVVQSQLKAKLSLRLPPNIDPQEVLNILRQVLTQSIPYECEVMIDNVHMSPGFLAKDLDPTWFQTLTQLNQQLFNTDPLYTFQGGSIGILHRLQSQFPEAIPCMTGIVSPESHIHGPDEFISLSYWSKLIFILTHLLTLPTRIHNAS